MEASDPALSTAPVPMRAILCIIINAVIAVVTKTCKSVFGLRRSISALEGPVPIGTQAQGQPVSAMAIDTDNPAVVNVTRVTHAQISRSARYSDI
jgi:hypothetical protein